MFFIVNGARKASRIATCYGPYASIEEARVSASGMVNPGDYVICGPAPVVQTVSIGAPVVSVGPVTTANP
jgi:hypothetical protein